MINKETRQYIAQHLNDDINSLALKKTPPGVDKQLALQQIEARQKLSDKVPSWAGNDELLFPPRLSIEQCSSELTALYKAQLVNGETFADLSGGLGIDCYFMSLKFRETDYVEMNPNLCGIAEHNFATLKANIKVINTKSDIYLERCTKKDCLFIDPARRDSHGKKVMLLSDCEPDIRPMLDTTLAIAPRLLIKLSPMLDISAALKEISHVANVHIVAVGNECKELLVDVRRDHQGAPRYFCCNLSTSQPIVEFDADDEEKAPLHLADEVSDYLYEPNATIMKSGFYKTIADKYKIEKLHVSSHLYTSSRLVKDFPGRVFAVERCEVYNKKNMKSITDGLKQANISTRNFPLSVAELRKKLSLSEGGNTYLFASTIKSGDIVIIRCRKVTRQ